MFSTRIFTNEKNEPNLYQHEVNVKTQNGDSVSIRCVFQDLKPAGNPLGTVVAMHGAPGSHKDYKYIAPLLVEQNIRFVGINFPAMGYTSYDHRLRDDNSERVQIVQSIVEALGLSEKVVFIGHSRGSENALKIGALNTDKTSGIVLVNPIGFRPHKGLRPYSLICAAAWIWKNIPGAQRVMNPLIFLIYNQLGLRTPNGRCAGVCLHLMWHADFAAQREFVDKLNKSKVRVLSVYSGNDFLVEPEISREFMSYFDGNLELVCSTREQGPEIEGETQRAIENGQQNLSIMFEKDGHFLQKTRASFLANSMRSLLTAENKDGSQSW